MSDRTVLRLLSPERLEQIRHVLGSCSLEADSAPKLYLELSGHIEALEAERKRFSEALNEAFVLYDKTRTERDAALANLAQAVPRRSGGEL